MSDDEGGMKGGSYDAFNRSNHHDEGGYGSNEDIGGAHGGFFIDMQDGIGQDYCVKCGGTHFRVIEAAHVVCKNCGTETLRHAMNAQLEYQNIPKGKAKMKKDAIQEKNTNNLNRGTVHSPSKRG
jgi:ribosomal protein L32